MKDGRGKEGSISGEERMASSEQHGFIGILATHLPEYFRDARVLEVGSLDINGTIRGLFARCEYTGIDVAGGKGVDVVCQGQDYDAPDGTFDHVVSCEAMEHNPSWKETFANMIRLCRSGGLVSMTCATTGRREHGTARTSPDSSPLTVAMGWDYYRNLSARDFTEAFPLASLFSRHRFFYDWAKYNLYFAGVRRGPEPAGDCAAGWDTFVQAADRSVMRRNASLKGVAHSVKARLLGEEGIRFLRKFRL
jgi:SAM-dependent methyltransferase